MTGVDHVHEATLILAEGEAAVEKLRDRHERGDFDAADDYGKKAAGCWTQAQAHATLALVEQHRIANLIAFVAHASAAVGDEATPEAIAYLSAITSQIREALGL
ncbi:MAG TPA: hypothetical protein VIP82_20860 [Microbacterium sp.]|uniref:hypothetical protein n=1 Tax=Microbacterium sp. TaxID=51671 RepID=UPI002F924819